MRLLNIKIYKTEEFKMKKLSRFKKIFAVIAVVCDTKVVSCDVAIKSSIKN